MNLDRGYISTAPSDQVVKQLVDHLDFYITEQQRSAWLMFCWISAGGYFQRRD